MIIIWRGWGIVAPLVAILVAVLAQAVVDGIGGPGTWSAHTSAQVVAIVLAGLALLLVGRWMNADYHASAGAAPRRHTFFFVPVEWWGVLVAVGGPVVLLTQ